jgi:hypothetical protein
MVWDCIRTDTIAPLNAHFCHVLDRMDCHVLAGDNADPHNTDKREHSQFNYTMNSAPQHHPPMPTTKAMGAITQNRHGHPTTTP